MITEDYVSFETAKLLKEKGFKGGGNYFYEKGELIDFNNYWWRITPKERYDSIQAPTLHMAMKWLREVHHIFLSIQQHMDMSYVWYAYVDGAAKGCDRESHNNTYEEACEAAIKYCLENLI